MGALVIILVLWIVVGIVSYKVGEAKGRGGLGLALGLVFGVLGLIVVAILPPADTFAYAYDGDGPAIRERDPVMAAITGRSTAASGTASIEERLTRLDGLLRRGIIGEAEYVHQRGRIISEA